MDKISFTKFKVKASIHKYGNVYGGSSKGSQFLIGYEPIFDAENRWLGFKYMIPAFGKKDKVLKFVYNLLFESTEQNQEKLKFWTFNEGKKIPLACKAPQGLNCF